MTASTHQYRVVRKVAVAYGIVSLVLKPDRPLERVRGGQHLVLLGPALHAVAVKREYSISGFDGECVRITVKREPGGLVSRWIHDEVRAGATLTASEPRGDFTLKPTGKPVVLLSCGVGVTPMMAMARELVDSGRPGIFVHACRDAAHHAFKSEMNDLRQRATGMRWHICYRHAAISDRGYDSSGELDRGFLSTLLPDTDCDVYICGPERFMQKMYDAAIALGVDPTCIHYELFSPAQSFHPRGRARPSADAPEGLPCDTLGPSVTFRKSAASAQWRSSARSLLEFAEDEGLNPDYSCRQGSCDSCKTRIVAGEVRYVSEPFERPEPGYALLCCSAPATDLELDL
jgi:ferredoxin-NADP reductase